MRLNTVHRDRWEYIAKKKKKSIIDIIGVIVCVVVRLNYHLVQFMVLFGWELCVCVYGCVCDRSVDREHAAKQLLRLQQGSRSEYCIYKVVVFFFLIIKLLIFAPI